MKTMRYILLTMLTGLTAAMLGGCADDDGRPVGEPTGIVADDAIRGGTPGDDDVVFSIDVAEKNWQGSTGSTGDGQQGSTGGDGQQGSTGSTDGGQQGSDWQTERVDATVTTRAGETIEGLKATYARSWDFTTIADKTALSAMNGLTFTVEDDSKLTVEDVDGAKAVKMAAGGILTMEGLKGEQSVTVTYKSVDGSGTFTAGNMSGTFGASAEKTTKEGTVTADGNVTLTATGGAMYIYTVDVSRSKDEGFDIVGAKLLGPTPSTKRLVTWDSSTGQWDAGEKIFWKRTTGTESFPVYAYAPHKPSSAPYTIDTETGVLTFPNSTEVDRLEQGYCVDLLYAGATVQRSDGVARLTFRHALAKMSFGDIVNNTGGTVNLTKISVAPQSGSAFNTTSTLDLTTGVWGAPTATSTTAITRNNELPMELANKAIKALSQDAIMLIPDATVIPDDTGKKDVTVTLVTDAGTFTFNTTLEEGKNKVYNITLEKNFEVVIE